MKYYHIESLGCAKNLVDSEVFGGILESAGYLPAGPEDNPEIVLISGCAFLQSALAEFDMVLSDYAQRKNDGEIGILIVTGCVMNRVAEEFEELFPEVDAWIGMKDYEALRKYVGRMGEPQTRVDLEGGYHAYLRISDGCQNYCSYCMIPSIRGQLKSVPMETLIEEAEALAERGAKELILIAQDSCLYGTDLYGSKALPELINKLHQIEAYHWIRLLYLHPDHFEEEWLELYAKYPKLLPYFEIPIQHSEDRILAAMNRSKGRDHLVQLFDEIRQRVPQAVLRTTLISGFPGETAGDHTRLMDFVSTIPFLHMGVFPFSPEPGTPAFEMPRQVSEKTALKRQDELLSLHRDSLEEIMGGYVGQKLEVLVEAEIDDEDCPQGLSSYMGRAWFQAPDIDGVVYFTAPEAQPGSFVEVEIEDFIDVDLFGSMILEKR